MDLLKLADDIEKGIDDFEFTKIKENSADDTKGRYFQERSDVRVAQLFINNLRACAKFYTPTQKSKQEQVPPPQKAESPVQGRKFEESVGDTGGPVIEGTPQNPYGHK